ncbi:hypothetical protein F5Y12DRAFT_711841 [Xylaria sp. FL1777]|nr:hypothetical protein F5Y12DRAFT_711841 [Xylaria sp. FL1777]
MATPDTDNSNDDYNEDTTTQTAISPLPSQQNPTKEAFDRIIQDARDNKLRLSSSEDRRNFNDTYKEFLNARVDENQTFLHIVVNNIGHQNLTNFLVKKYPQLLDIVDDSGRTPLFIAVIRKNYIALAAIMKSHKNPDSLLATTCDHGRNSIHAAIFHHLDEENALKLIDKASEKTLCIQDQDGLTPLHLAVQYDSSSESRLRIVQKLLPRGSQALDKFTAKPKDLSVYEYHEYTRKLAEPKLGSDCKADVCQKTTDNEPLSATANSTKKRHEAGFLTDQDDGWEEGSLSRLHGIESGNSLEYDTRREWANKILYEIKLRLFRSTFESDACPIPRDQSQALRFLHGTNTQDLNLCFDYSKAPTTIDSENFKEAFSHMRFDIVLRYVAFNKIELQSPSLKTPQCIALHEIKKPHQMKTVLKKIGVDQEVHKFIEVWNRFEDPAKRLKMNQGDASNIMIELAVSIVASQGN